MKRSKLFLLGLSLIFVLSGCVVRTYKVTKARGDQGLSEGNRGYLKGQAPSEEMQPERKTTRTNRVLEIELHSPIKFEKMPQAKTAEKVSLKETTQESLQGNRGYIAKREASRVTEAKTLQKYTVQKEDTLQKISLKFYGTTKKWTKIYEANQDVLKGPNKIYPGQVINIPVESLKETKENLK